MVTVTTEVVIFRGIVQGVGFRPTVYRIAAEMGMVGSVRNMGGSVQVVVTDTPERIGAFVEAVERGRPRMSRITSVERKAVATVPFDTFTIEKSSATENTAIILPADIAVCEDCMAEFADPKNFRYRHPFISCTNCGPRYSIMESIPYDRDTTTMVDFEMCEHCRREYEDPLDRRYHAQTVSCHDCGPRPMWRERDGAANEQAGEAAVRAAGEALARGEVIAFKGTGGYYLSCDARDEEAVLTLRRVKHRDKKPFAVMFRSADEAAHYCLIGGPGERDAIESERRPIVLLEANERGERLADETSKDSRFVGAFLPSLALQYMLLEYASPLVMTSANHEGIPIITEDEDVFDLMEKSDGVAGVLYNERRIAVSLDDSVATTPLPDGKVRPTRRAKGFAPAPVYVKSAAGLREDASVFAAGGHLKSAFAITKGNYVYLSPHLGDMENIRSEELYRKRFAQMKSFFGIEPSGAVCDMHPRYYPTQFAEQLARGSDSSPAKPILHVQHHHAHIASVMAEHGLAGPVIGVAFDGTGYGEDGAIWGGEILICEGGEYERYSHLRYIDLPGGDEGMREAWKAAIAHMAASGRGDAGGGRNEKGVSGQGDTPTGGGRTFEIDIADAIRFSEEHGTLAKQEGADTVRKLVAQREGTIACSSMGRLFDAVSALLGIRSYNHYEGECAIMLENFAYVHMQGIDVDAPTGGRRAAWCDKISAHEDWREAARLAHKFHLDVAEAVLAECRAASAEPGRRTRKRVALSGGVFQNRILLREVTGLLQQSGFDVYMNESVPANDGGIALGQAYIGMQNIAGLTGSG